MKIASAIVLAVTLSLTAQAQTMQPLTALDYFEIQQLASKYARAIDTCSNNGYDYADLFAADGYFQPEQGGKLGAKFQGRERLAEASGGGSRGCKNVGWIKQGVKHLYVNHIITASPEGATGTVDMLMIGLNGDPYKIRHEGYYEDTYVRTPQGWRFKSTHPPRADDDASGRGGPADATGADGSPRVSFREIWNKSGQSSPDQGIDSRSARDIQPKTYCGRITSPSRPALPPPRTLRRASPSLAQCASDGGQRQVVAASVWLLSAGWAVISAAPAQDVPAPAASPAAANHRAVLDKYCVTCHNQRTRASDLALDVVDVGRPSTNGQVWEDVIRKLRARSMPPQGMPRPDEASYTALTTWLESELDRAAASAPNPGRPLIRRLNRSEYANAVRDLLDLDVDVSSMLPPDDSAFGFDNIADMLGTSPALLERYLVAADRVSALAVGAPVAPGSDVYRIRQDRSQDQHIEGLPLGSVGGLVVTHNFPLDGEYHFSLALYRTNLESIRGLEHPHQIEITVDGARVFIATIGGEVEKPEPGGPGRGGLSITDRSDAVDARLQVRVPVTAGPHTVGATFVRKIGEGSQRLRPFLRSSAGTYDNTGRPHIETLTVAGPFNPTGPGNTPSRQRIFSVVLRLVRRKMHARRRSSRSLSRRAFRRPVTKPEVARILEFYTTGREKGTFDTGIQLALRRILASPTFVFRVEEDGAFKPGTIHRVSDVELASRLSFFLWSSIPTNRSSTSPRAGSSVSPPYSSAK
jgi:hypothetical protein